MNMDQTECSDTSAYKIQTLGNYPEESIQHSEHGESLKSRINNNDDDDNNSILLWRIRTIRISISAKAAADKFKIQQIVHAELKV